MLRKILPAYLEKTFIRYILLIADRILVLDKGKSPISISIPEAYPRQLETDVLVKYKHEILDLLL